MTASPTAATQPARQSNVHRIEVRAAVGEPDPLAESLLDAARRELGKVISIRTAKVYLIAAPLDEVTLTQVAAELLSDPVSQDATIGIDPAAEATQSIEAHYQPGVMDPVAQSTQDAINEMLPSLADDHVEVRTGVRVDLRREAGAAAFDQDALQRFAERYLANTVIQDIHLEPFHPASFPEAPPYQFNLTHVPITGLDDDALMKMSREAHLFLSLDEMRAIRDYYRSLPGDREPTDIELETLAQTWSEHCVHKTLKATIRYTQEDDSIEPGISHFATRDGHEVAEGPSVVIRNLLKTTIAASTHRLMKETDLGEWCVSVFDDNAGVVKFDAEDGVNIKVETHNHPSAIEPYGGAATGIGGCIRDILGTGLAARPIANTDVFCVADPNWAHDDLPKGVIHPRRILQRVVDGVRDYGNRKGIPTVSGGVWFHDDYLGNPLVFAGCIGLIPLDSCFGKAQPGDRIIALGGATGRDGIHGATFSSAELTDTHADEFGHAVQIGNAITQKKTLDVILQARDHEAGCLYSAITDCGAGGFSSAVGEMGEKVGANVTLHTAPLKYQGLSYHEIWISEAQERMVLSVPPEHVETLRAMCEREDVEMCDLGEFGVTNEADQPMLVLNYHEHEVGRISMTFLHDGIPMPVREATWSPRKAAKTDAPHVDDLAVALKLLLGHPNIASKHWIIRQYDHEVQGGSTVKPLVGPVQDGPSDASVIRPKLGSDRGIAISSGLQTGLCEKHGGDSYWMALAAIDEVVRNLVCVGADPSRICILDNFCWPSCDDPKQLGSLVRAAEACYDGAMAYRTPFVSGKDSLNNQFTRDDGKVIAIPPTLLITGMGIVPDVKQCVTMDAKAAGNRLLLVGDDQPGLLGSHLAMVTGNHDGAFPRVNLGAGPRTAGAVAKLIEVGLVEAAHDVSDGGLLVAAAEMAFAGRVGLDLDLPDDDLALLFGEAPTRYLIEVSPDNLSTVEAMLGEDTVAQRTVGAFADHDRLTLGSALDVALDDLRDAWLAPLDW